MFYDTERENRSDISEIQGFTNISSSRGFTIMFDLSKSFSQLYIEIYGEKIYFFLHKLLKMV
jgi:hypothetical protein